MKGVSLRCRYFISGLHILLTFLIERFNFYFSWDNITFRTAIPIDNFISDKAEMALTYIVSKLIAIILILLFWRLVFSIIDKNIDLDILKIFGGIFVCGLVIGLFLYPTDFGIEIDNYATLAQSIRFLPTYWHSIYTGALYAGIIMAFGHPFFIFVVQWALYVVAIAGIYCLVSRMTNGSYIKYFSLLFFIIPDNYEIIFDAYRNNWYTILCLLYFTYVLRAVFSQQIGLKEKIYFAIASGFLMVWRSEGIFIGIGGIILLLVRLKSTKKQIVSIIVIMAGSFVLFSSIQKIGDSKYYAGDYKIINTINVLNDIFNDPYANLTYDGATNDLANIEAVVPVQIIKETGINGYRNYNYTQGRDDSNQSMAGAAASKSYMKSYYRIVAHNLKDYISVQLSCIFSCLEFNITPKIYTYTGGEYTSLITAENSQKELGIQDLKSTFLTEKWENNQVREKIASTIEGFFSVVKVIMSYTKLMILVRIMTILGIFRGIIVDIKNAIVIRDYKNIDTLMISLVIGAEILAIIMFMPEGRLYYLYPMLYTSYLLIYYRAAKEIS